MRKLTLFLSCVLLLSSAPGAKPKPGEIPVKFPAVKTSAKAGDCILCPPRLWLDQAFQKGVDQQTFIFYGAAMDKPGPLESGIKTLMGESQVMPNSLIIPLKRGQKAKVGDMVLTWWQSGSGLKRAIVVKGGSLQSPRVLYVDMDYDNPAGIAQKEDTLKPDSFHGLSQPLEPGTAAAVREGTSWKHAQVIRVQGDQVLLLGFAGRLKVARKQDCVGLPVRPPALKPGSTVIARTSYGTMEPGRVKKVDGPIGRVFVEFTGGLKQTVAVAFGDLTLKLP